MELNEIKKALYKTNPVASFIKISKGIAFYMAWVGEDAVLFQVPVSDMGDAIFEAKMEAKLLIRYICK